jgi:hypothetical protein
MSKHIFLLKAMEKSQSLNISVVRTLCMADAFEVAYLHEAPASSTCGKKTVQKEMHLWQTQKLQIAYASISIELVL